MKPLIYLAGPYTYPDPVTNTRKAVLFAGELVRRGFIPIIPHLSLLWHIISPKPRTYDFWMDIDLEYLRRCDALYRLSGKSKGADKEVEFALRNGIPVFFKMTDLEEWKNETFDDNFGYRCAGCDCSANPKVL